MNFIAERDARHEVKRGPDNIHRIQEQKPIKVVFYKNGILLEGFPFYTYQSNSAISILSDIYEGFFPIQLKKKFPDGVVMIPEDKSQEEYDTEAKPKRAVHFTPKPKPTKTMEEIKEEVEAVPPEKKLIVKDSKGNLVILNRLEKSL